MLHILSNSDVSHGVRDVVFLPACQHPCPNPLPPPSYLWPLFCCLCQALLDVTSNGEEHIVHVEIRFGALRHKGGRETTPRPKHEHRDWDRKKHAGAALGFDT